MNRLLKLEKVFVKNFNQRKNIDLIFKFNHIDAVYYKYSKFISGEYSLNNDPFYDIVRIDNISGYTETFLDGKKIDYRELIKNHFSSGRKLTFRTIPDHHQITIPVHLEYTGYILRK